MIKKKKPQKRGPKPIVFDEELIIDLAKIQCTNAEIAACCKCSRDTLEKKFSALIKMHREAGKCSLRRAQWKKGVYDGNVAMLIWLGKHMLNQKEAYVPQESHKAQVVDLLRKWDHSHQAPTPEDAYEEMYENNDNIIEVATGMDKIEDARIERIEIEAT